MEMLLGLDHFYHRTSEQVEESGLLWIFTSYIFDMASKQVCCAEAHLIEVYWGQGGEQAPHRALTQCKCAGLWGEMCSSTAQSGWSECTMPAPSPFD